MNLIHLGQVEKMIKSIAISPNELGHHPSLLTQMMQYNPTIASNDDTDFLVTCDNGDLLAIERKSPNDFLASIVDGRIKSQVEKMKVLTKWVHIVITGDLKTEINKRNEKITDSRHKWTIGKVEGAKMSPQQMGCVVIHCDGEDDFIPCIVRIANRSRDNIIVKPVRQITVFGGQEATLASMPGIGSEKAMRYFQMFGTLSNAVMSLCAPDLAKDIQGWGKKSAQTLYDYFAWDDNGIIGNKEDENDK